MRALGLMSGTSMDGVDAAILETDGERVTGFGPVASRPYTHEQRALLRRAVADARGLADRTARPGALAEAEATVTAVHAEVVCRLLADPDAGAVDVVGFLGQTVLLRREIGLTLQLGDGPALARSVGLPVVYDFPVGHVRANATMPIGALAEIDTTGDKPVVRILEEPTAVR